MTLCRYATEQTTKRSPKDPWTTARTPDTASPDLDMSWAHYHTIAFVIYNHETRHYFTVVINYKLHHITTYSHHISSENAHYAWEPDKWGGQYIWRNVCTLFNWELPAQKLTYWAIDWKQVRDQSLFFLYHVLDLFVRMAMIAVP